MWIICWISIENGKKKYILKLRTPGRENILKLTTGTENVHVNSNNYGVK